VPPRNDVTYRYYEGSMTKVTSRIETEKQTDCRAVPPRNDVTNRSYFEVAKALFYYDLKLFHSIDHTICFFCKRIQRLVNQLNT